MLRKILWFLAFIATGTGLLVLSLFKITNKSNQFFLIIIAFLFFIGLTVHLDELQNRRK